ncbi:MAG: amidohydrolase family protein, partial [Solirubrobacterales bacterium]|nr:amidohydrolase family protein [Solirubrobacterales bacterium]
LEPVLADHPGLRLVIPHFGWPWVSEALMLAVKYPTVMLDTSVLFAGTPEQSLGRVVRQQVGVDIVNGPLADQVVFGSAYPRVDPKRVRWAVDALGLEPQAHEKIMSRNGRRLLGGTLA